MQLEHLRTQPAVASRLAAGKLTLHGWVYKLETGKVFAYDPRQGQFAPIEDVTLQPLAAGRLAQDGAI
ncbi:Carbonic anhydrase [compost metagenome]